MQVAPADGGCVNISGFFHTLDDSVQGTFSFMCQSLPDAEGGLQGDVKTRIVGGSMDCADEVNVPGF